MGPEPSKVITAWVDVFMIAGGTSIKSNPKWQELVKRAQGTNCGYEEKRLKIILTHMWDVLSLVQPRSDADGFGEEWSDMLLERTWETAEVAAEVAKGVQAKTGSSACDTAMAVSWVLQGAARARASKLYGRSIHLEGMASEAAKAVRRAVAVSSEATTQYLSKNNIINLLERLINVGVVE